MRSVCLYFQVHQPYRLRSYSFFDLGKVHDYENEELNRNILNRVSEKCYLPANALFKKLIDRYDVKLTFSLSGTLLEQLENWRPDVLVSFQQLVQTGNVELLSETYYHSLAYCFSKPLFREQVEKHGEKLTQLFNYQPQVFRNTELIYNNSVAKEVAVMGYKGILAEGLPSFAQAPTANYVFNTPFASDIKILTRNYQRTDDVAFRFSDTNWAAYPLTPKKFASLLGSEKGDVISLFMDYETIGEHHWADTGIFDFWEKLPQALFSQSLEFKTASETINSNPAKHTYDVPPLTSWADTERDLSAWLANAMQKEAAQRVYDMEEKVRNTPYYEQWCRLLTSDHLYYMSTKQANDGAVHNYFSPFNSPYDNYIYFMNALADLEIRLDS